MIQFGLIPIFLLFTWFSFSTSVTLSPCAKWNQTGVIIAGNGSPGNATDQLYDPLGIFFHKRTNTLYIADGFNNRIQMIPLNQSSLIATTIISGVDVPTKIYADDDENNQTIIYISLQGSERVEKWIQGETSGVQVGDTCDECSCVYLDSEKNVYMCNYKEDDGLIIRKWSPKTNITTIVAKDPNRPNDIYIDQTTDSIYITDQEYIRVWQKNSSTDYAMVNEIKVPLGFASGIWVDENTKIVYTVSDRERTVQRWHEDKSEIIIANDSKYHRSYPGHITFDNEGNLYLCDPVNHVVKSYALINNQTCPSADTPYPGPITTPHYREVEPIQKNIFS